MPATDVIGLDGYVVGREFVERQCEIGPIPDVDRDCVVSGCRSVANHVTGEIRFSVRVPPDRYAACERRCGEAKSNERCNTNTTE